MLPERRTADVTPAVCKASAGAVEHLAVAQVRNLADFLARGQGARAAGATAPTRTATIATTRGRLGRAASCSCSAPRGEGLRPRVAAACDALVSVPLRGRIESLSVSAAAAVLLYAASAAPAAS